MSVIINQNNAITFTVNNIHDKIKNINFGVKNFEVVEESIDFKTNKIQIKDTQIKINDLPYISIYKDELNKFRLGPLIGVYVDKMYKEEILKGSVNNGDLKLSQQTRKNGGVLIFFTFEDIDFKRDMINGITLKESTINQFINIKVPLPRVIYSHCLSSEEVFELKEKVKKYPNIRIIDSLKNFKKSDVNFLLLNHPVLNKINDIRTNLFLQKEINRTSFLGNKFHIEVVLKKDHSGEWEIIGILVIVKPENNVTNNNNEKIINFNAFLQIMFLDNKEKVEKVLNDIEYYCKMIGQVLDSEFGLFGDVCIKMEMDTDLKLWVSNIEDQPLLVEKLKPVNNLTNYKLYTYPMLFSSYLDGYKLYEKKTISNKEENIYSLIIDDSLQSRSICLSKKQIDLLSINVNNPVILKIGSKTISIDVQVADNSITSKVIKLSSDIFSETGLYSGIKLMFIHSIGNTLCFGPMFGYMISPENLNRIKRGFISKMIRNIADIANSLGCALCFFTAKNVLLEEKKMKGLLFNWIKGKWEERTLPIPDIVYNRYRYKNIISYFKNKDNTSIINYSSGFGKSVTNEALSFFQETKGFVPETYKLNNLEVLIELLQKYQTVFAKTEYGSGGRQVIRIERKQNEFICEVGGKKHVKKSFNNIQKVFKYVKNKIGLKNTLIQQGINLSNYKGNVYDLRVLIQKEKSNDWNINLITMRIASNGNAITNICSGGKRKILPLNKLERYIDQIKPKDLSNFSKKCAIAIESTFGQQGEIGLDVGIDTTGRMYLIEANSKPLKSKYATLCGPDQVYHLFSAPIFYSIFLAKMERDIFINNIDIREKLPHNIAFFSIR